jgi:hypothetical protein
VGTPLRIANFKESDLELLESMLQCLYKESHSGVLEKETKEKTKLKNRIKKAFLTTI